MNNFQIQPTILLIQSSSNWRTNVCSALQTAGYKVLIASSGDEGFCLAQRLRPDLIICEAAMRDISGVQLCYMIRADRELKSVVVVLIDDVNSENSETVLESFRAGADDYFAKNCNLQFFAAKIARLIALRYIERQLQQRQQNLRRSESQLAKIIKDTSNLVAALNSTSNDLDNYNDPRPKRAFGENAGLKKKPEVSEIWKETLQLKENFEVNNIRIENRKKVYYEIAC